MLKSILCSGLLVGVLLLASGAEALTISYSDSISSTQTDWSSNLSFSQFDPSLGTLDSITITLVADISDGYVHYVSTSASTTRFYGTIAAVMSIDSPTGADLLVDAAPLIVVATSTSRITVAPYATGNTAHGSASATSTSTLLYSDLAIADQQLFVGTGTVDLPISALSSSGITTLGSGLSTTPIITASGYVTVTYNYTFNEIPPATVPEPATLLLFGSGALLSGYAVRRRGKKQA